MIMESQWFDYDNEYLIVDNAVVFGMGSAVRASKFPMLTTVSNSDNEHELVDSYFITDTQSKLAMSAAGSGEDCFLSGIIVTMELTLTNKAWVEFERYHFAQIVSSQSTMHKLQGMKLKYCTIGYVDEEILKRMEQLQERYNQTHDKDDRLRMLYSCPSGLLLTAGVVTNYRQLKTMYKQRHNHTLPEWRRFCEWMETLPHSEWVTGKLAVK